MDAAMRHARIVAFGGGTGMSTLLGGLKHHSPHLTAVVAMADDGGSSGRLRQSLDALPPGDIRSCLVALARAEPMLARLFQYRFEEGELKGHSFGNLFLTALTKLTGSLVEAIEYANRILRVEGRVVPSTSRKVSLVAEHFDGTKTTGQSRVEHSGKPIRTVSLQPDPGEVSSSVRTALAEADLVTFGPGSLFTSVIPPLLVTGTCEAIGDSDALKVFVMNVMTQPGETDGFTAADHLEAFQRHAPGIHLDAVLAHRGEIPPAVLNRYRHGGSEPVRVEAQGPWPTSAQLIWGDLANASDLVRHDPARLSEALIAFWRGHLRGHGVGDSGTTGGDR